jgi:hypothetical protein
MVATGRIPEITADLQVRHLPPEERRQVMSKTATVTKVTRTANHDAARTEVDIVQLEYDGKLYFWSAKPGMYAAGQQVSVTAPPHVGANIAPAEST